MKLTVLHNDELVAEYSVDDLSTKVTQLDNVIYIGRSDECHVVIDDKQISRQHIKVFKNATGWEFEKVSDLGQTLLNGSIVSRGALKNGDTLSFNGYILNVFIPQVQNTITTASVPIQPLEKTNSLPDLKQKLADKGVFEEENLSPVEEPNSSLETEILNNPEEVAHTDEAGEASANFESSENLSSENASNDLQAENPESETNFQNQETDAINNEATESNLPVESGEGASEGTVVFKGFANFELHLFGENAPFDVFNLTDRETFIGRNADKCQIVLDDPEVSGVHAKITKTKISCTLEDLNSSNGTLVNGKRINNIDLSNGDEFVIGGTTFSVHVKSDLLEQEAGSLMPVEEKQEITTEEVVEEEVEFEGTEGINLEGNATTASSSGSLFSKEALKDPAKRKKLLYIVVALLGAYMFLGEEEPAPPPADAAKTEKTAPGAKDQGKEDKSRLLNPNATPEAKTTEVKKKTLSPEMERQIEGYYQQAKAYISRGEFDKAIIELNRYFDSYPDYKNTSQLYQSAKQGAAQLEEADRRLREQEERKKRRKEVEALLEKAKEAVKERQVMVSESLFGQILEKDPENLDVPQLKLELDAWKKEQERAALEKAQKEAERKRQLSLLQPGKTAFIKKDWNVAIVKLDQFLKNKNIDEDLVKEASEMLNEAKNNLNDLIAPLLGQARSLKEGQDLKGAYQLYAEILKKEPSNVEAINEMNEIRALLDDRAKKLYREAIISESLSLFDDAKEKFQEVQQNTPTDSEYYKKASDKLKNYME